ncbi:hypothetical protein Tco_1271013, partial [Tanacetum coccineum]
VTFHCDLCHSKETNLCQNFIVLAVYDIAVYDTAVYDTVVYVTAVYDTAVYVTVVYVIIFCGICLIRESVDIKATNIVLQGLPQYIYSLVNHNEDAKQIWDRVKLLIQDLELSLQERESKLYDDFDIFTYMPGETNHSYYMRFAQLINDMHTIGMTMKPL